MNLNIRYTPLPKKYRPKSFTELAGQESLIKILNYAIKNDKISPAYLFHGSRGIGKTTTARIFAKLINCQNKNTNDDGISIACEECNNCKNFANHPDVVELDAASNTSVDDARLMINNSEYIPLIGKYKVFIIDEVHMLSKSAFNALLKTLEEPNESAIFILATTEINKIPLTVISRCQRFDLRKFTQKETKNLLSSICKKENITYEDNALDVIAQKSYGSARDSISILEQIVVAALANSANSSTDSSVNDSASHSINHSITKDLVCETLGVVCESEITDILISMLKQDIKTLTNIIDSLEAKNIDFVVIAEDITGLLLFLCKIKIMKSHEANFDFYSYSLDEINTILSICTTHKLMIFLQIFSRDIHEIKSGYNQRIYFEMTCIKCAYSIEILDLNEIINSDFKGGSGANIESLNYIKNEAKKESQTSAQKTNPKEINKQKTEENKLKPYSILKYLYQKNEFEIYYYLMNKCSFDVVEENILTIKTDNIDNEMNTKIQSVLSEMNNCKWKINVIKEMEFTSYKQMLSKNFVDSDVYKIITENFANPKVVDILFDTKIYSR